MSAYLRGTRVLATLALLALVGGVVSDAWDGGFWSKHSLLAGLVASLSVVMLTVALVNEALERRSRQRWSVLAQYVMLQLVREARLVWTWVAQLTGLMPSDPYATDSDAFTAAASIDAGSGAVRDTERLTAAVRELVADADERKRLHDEVTIFLERDDAVLVRGTLALALRIAPIEWWHDQLEPGGPIPLGAAPKRGGRVFSHEVASGRAGTGRRPPRLQRDREGASERRARRGG